VAAHLEARVSPPARRSFEWASGPKA
jgi:hypothetical protein